MKWPICNNLRKWDEILVKNCERKYGDADCKKTKELFGSGEIRTRASEETGALNQRLIPLGHATFHTIYILDKVFQRTFLPK